MEYRKFGNSGLNVLVLSLGTGTFGRTNEFFGRWGCTDLKEASRLIDISMERRVNFFDTANVYSQGASEEILGLPLKAEGAGQSSLPKDHLKWAKGSMIAVLRGFI